MSPRLSLAGAIVALILAWRDVCTCWDYETPDAPCTCGARR